MDEKAKAWGRLVTSPRLQAGKWTAMQTDHCCSVLPTPPHNYFHLPRRQQQTLENNQIVTSWIQILL